MSVSTTIQKNTEASIETLWRQIGQLAKQLDDILSPIFSANTHTNSKENCSVVRKHQNVVIKVMEDKAGEEPEEVKSQEENCEIIQQTQP